MNLTRTLRTQCGRASLWTVLLLLPLPLAAFGAYTLIGVLDAMRPLDQATVSAVAPSVVSSVLLSASRVAAVEPDGLSAEAADAAKRAASIEEQPPTF